MTERTAQRQYEPRPSPTRAPTGKQFVAQLEGVTKRYGDVVALKDATLRVRPGEVLAVLGPNGAGKTTAVNLMLGLLRPDEGAVSLFGTSPEDVAAKVRIGAMLQISGVPPTLTVREHLTSFAAYYPSPLPVNEAIELAGLTEVADRQYGKLSGGQKQRLHFGLAMIGDPDLLFLDEPTTGFDPTARRDAWGLVRNLRELGKTVLLTTHYMDEAQQLADRVAIIARGVIIAEGTPASLMAVGAETTITFRPADGGALPEGLPGAMEMHNGMVTLKTTEPTLALHGLTSWALATEVGLEELSVSRPSLEDVYLRLTAEAEAARLSERSEA